MSRRKDAEPTWASVVGLAAYGLWKRMEVIMLSSPSLGRLLHADGSAMPPADLARHVGELPATVNKLLTKLEGVRAIRLDGAVIVADIIVRRAEVSAVRSELGKRGAEARATQLSLGVEPFAKQKDAGAKQTAKLAAPAMSVGGAGGEGSSAVGRAPSTTTDTTTSTTPGASARVGEAALRSRSDVERDEYVKRLLEKMPTDGDRMILVDLLHVVPGSVRSWAISLDHMLSPDRMHGKPATADQLATAVRHFVANGHATPGNPNMNSSHFAAYVRRAIAGTLTSALPQRRDGRPAQEAYDATGNDRAVALLNRGKREQ